MALVTGLLQLAVAAAHALVRYVLYATLLWAAGLAILIWFPAATQPYLVYMHWFYYPWGRSAVRQLLRHPARSGFRAGSARHLWIRASDVPYEATQAPTGAMHDHGVLLGAWYLLPRRARWHQNRERVLHAHAHAHVIDGHSHRQHRHQDPDQAQDRQHRRPTRGPRHDEPPGVRADREDDISDDDDDDSLPGSGDADRQERLTPVHVLIRRAFASAARGPPGPPGLTPLHSAPPRPTLIIYFHGNAGHRGSFSRVPFLRSMASVGTHSDIGDAMTGSCHVLVADYRGFGDSVRRYSRRVDPHHVADYEASDAEADREADAAARLAGTDGTDGAPAVLPSEPGVQRDAEAVLRYALCQCRVPLDRIVLVGHSLGTGVAAYVAHQLHHHPERFLPQPVDGPIPATAAARPRLGGLVLLAGYASMPEAALGYPFVPVLKPIAWLARYGGACGRRVAQRLRALAMTCISEKWPTAQRLEGDRHVAGGVGCPLLIAHGMDDIEIPCLHGETLFRAALRGQLRQLRAAGGSRLAAAGTPAMVEAAGTAARRRARAQHALRSLEHRGGGEDEDDDVDRRSDVDLSADEADAAASARHVLPFVETRLAGGEGTLWLPAPRAKPAAETGVVVDAAVRDASLWLLRVTHAGHNSVGAFDVFRDIMDIWWEVHLQGRRMPDAAAADQDGDDDHSTV
ncbi:hypothetical protein CXG81DRAFT_26458 [Caulochytrium protostelioides]|uniref:Alpha/beta-hydrolase n=1 Tax=Caulochytrium protostelioides TaxID=1555241 RepID=A0A4P9WVI9_9FUNG|nr:alpha/beta-hydrolase [Caulochytrium protostelioides]RKP00834.1 hypothetical protein CXG81DRAFT_26458 [Caulochytrium protostelioides]|eukprot:RKP00834.1 hypothetical protein CXG81DRAFT_26458 [Caulochytrium protostelioides]